MSAIRRYARLVAHRFEPEKIILFGSHAYGRPHVESDVDILVVMTARNQLDQAFKIPLASKSMASPTVLIFLASSSETPISAPPV
jgi:predicted nucleotidyltransferase